MSHLPLDARAILHYLNELGYRNISALQLKEFLKGMQPQSEINNKCKYSNQQQQQHQLSKTPTKRNTTTRPTESASHLQENPTSTSTAANSHEISKRSPSVKVVKCRKPLCNFKFYLDICDHQLTKRIEDQIKILGGSLEFFLTPSVTHFITDKTIVDSAVNSASANTCQTPNISCPVTPQTPKTPLTPLTPFSLECFTDSTKPNNGLANKKPIRNSRADAILNSARRQSTINVSTPTTSRTLKNRDLIAEKTINFTNNKQEHNKVSNEKCTAPLYVIWQCDVALRFFKKVQNELFEFLGRSDKTKTKSYAIEPISLKGSFIKFESIKRNFRPYYHLFKKPQEWPKVQLNREEGAFRFSPKKELPLKELKEITKVPELNGVVLFDNMTRKSRTKSSQNHSNLKNKGNDNFKSPANSQKPSSKCKNQTPQNQKDSSEKQCGVCEICKIEYDALAIHLKTKDHEYFAKNSQNFMALDSLIHSSADVNKFLDENKKLGIKTELEEMEVDDEGLIVMEQDPLLNSDNENAGDDDNENEEDEDEDDQSQKSSSTSKRKSVEPKAISPTLREKSKRSTKGKHSSEKFQNCSLISTAKAPKTTSPQKSLAPLDVKTYTARKKPSSSAVMSPPIRAMLPPSSMYKVVETHTEVHCTPPRGKGVAAGLKGNSNVGSPSIIVKFKKVRNTELEVLNGEAENFMFPKKHNDSSELPTDVDRQTTSDRVQRTQSSQQVLSSSSSSEEQEPEDDYEVKRKAPVAYFNGKKAIARAKRKLPKLCPSSVTATTPGREFKQSFPKAPIQPNEQLKSEKRSTTAITSVTKRKSLPVSLNRVSKDQSATTVVTVSNKILLPEATRKSSRTATAIVTAATTSTRLLQAAVEAAKSKQRLETSIKSKLSTSLPPTTQYQKQKAQQVKKELHFDSEKEEEDENTNDNDVKRMNCRSKKLRCSRSSVVKVEDRMGDTIKKPRYSLNERKLIHGFDADDYEDDDITIDGEEDDDDDNDEDFIVQSPKVRNKVTPKSTKKQTNSVPTKTIQMSSSAPKISLNSKHKAQTQTPTNLTVREERLARRQSRLITQLQLELQTASEEEPCKEFPKPRSCEKRAERKSETKIEKKSEKNSIEISTSKTPTKLTKPESPPKKSPKKSTMKTNYPAKTTPPTKINLSTKSNSSPKENSAIQQGSLPPSQPSRYFDYTKSDRIKEMCYAFERLPAADLWYRVYKRQDNCEEKYFEYFGSTKYRKLPYELGPIPFESTLFDHNRHKMSCKLCEDIRLKKDSDKVKKHHVRRDLQPLFKSEPCPSHNNINTLESQDANNQPSSSGHVKHHLTQGTNSTINDMDQDQKHSNLNCSSHAAETKSYAHKHKKLHLLQRYRQELEQQELLQRQKLDQEKNNSSVISTSDIKAEDVTQECPLSRCDRAGSTHSNASSCNSITHTNCKSRKIRNKLLNKVSFLANLELPPRKSPREHASTLALVSCIIKQRQDSLSKPNSETDEPPTTPTETAPKLLKLAAEKLKGESEIPEREPPKTPPPSDRKKSVESPVPNVIHSPRTRSQAATPIEELRFATEISETVKRMRRGRNKYDYSPPFVQRVGRPASARGRGRGAKRSVVNLFGAGDKVPAFAAPPASNLGSSTQARTKTPKPNLPPHITGNGVTRGRRRRGRQKGYNKIPRVPENVLTSIRKTGSKKGVLEFDVDNVAIEALRKATTEYVNPKLLEWQIDKFLTLMNKDYGNDLLLATDNITMPSDNNEDVVDAEDNNGVQEIAKLEHSICATTDININTPPATDYFSSDFDLCDILNQSTDRLQVEGENSNHIDRRIKKFSIFNTVHLNKYFRKRKNPKTNRTGWPKAPKKKAVTRQQSMQDKIYFLQNGSIREEKCENKISIKKAMRRGKVKYTKQEQPRRSGVITPPDSENEEDYNVKQSKMANADDEESLLIEEDSQMVLNEDSQTAIDDDDDDDDDDDGEEDELDDDARIIEEDEETLADFVVDVEEEEEEDRKQKTDSDADADADIEEAEDDEGNTGRGKVQQKCLDKKLNKKCKKIIPKIVENDDEDSYEPQEKRICNIEECPEDKIRTNLLNPNSAFNSTPSTPFLRALRRTPQLNGSLGSCISPSEKAGDNSDIFTVSSDGLDTDLDLSNSQSQLRSTNCAADDDDLHQHHHHHHNTSTHSNAGNSTITPKRKFDISKYAPTNVATCAAEAATAAVKSRAITQFLKKEVRVTCRRLRAPFRRFRYRR